MTVAGNRCLAHLGSDDLDDYLSGLEPGSPLQGRGVTFTEQLLTRLLRAVTDDEGPRPGNADFRGATFAEAAHFDHVTFAKSDFACVTFTGSARFTDVAFTDTADFSGATFADIAFFRNAEFAEIADFGSARFTKGAAFGDSTFTGAADFRGATFTEATFFIGVTFTNGVNFSSAVARAEMRLFCRAGILNFRESEVTGELTVEGPVNLLLCSRMRSAGRATLRLRGTEVDAEDAVFAGPLTVHGLQQPLPWADEEHLLRAEGDGVRPVALVSLRGVDAERLVLTDVDLSRCRFAGIHRLDQIVLDGRCSFAPDPSRRRQVLAEEHHWRAGLQGRRAARWTAAPDEVEVVGPERLQVLYRQLRKAFEESKNEPGAASFYYGEMEMRRAAATRGRDRWLLNAYWATSGYALRARRALAWLVALMLATIFALTMCGFPAKGRDVKADGTLTAYSGTTQTIRVTVHQSDPAKKTSERIGKATEVTLNAVIFRAPDTELTTAGRYIDIAARLLGPLFLGFSLLAIRNRVKR